MAQPRTLSPSKLTTYLACPLKFRWTYLDARGRWYLKAKSYYSFGSTLHKVLERFHDSADSGVETVGQAVAAVEDNWISAGYSSAEEMTDALGEGKAMIERYVEERLSAPTGAQVLFIEKRLSADLGPFKLIGRLDRVDEYPDGTLEIIDYKSGRGDVSAEEVATDIAMGCYQLLLKALYPDRQIKATIIALRTGASATASLSDSELDEFRRDVIVIGEQILSEEFEELAPIGKQLCFQCDFLPLCKKHSDFELPPRPPVNPDPQ